MPELPEVETVKTSLRKSIVGKKIAGFECDWAKMINKKITDCRLQVAGKKITDVRRRAKMIILKLSKNQNILIHLKMTGQLVYAGKIKCVVGGHPIKEGYECLPNKFTHATFTFSDKSHLYFNDVRKFGWLKLFSDSELKRELEKLNLGPEPLNPEFDLAYLKQKIASQPQKKIKAFLMDAQNAVGIGNIYSDEICFFAKVKPERKVKDLKPQEISLIFKGIKKILRDSIKAQGTTFRDFRNADGEAGGYSKKLKVYGRYGQKCSVCGAEIKKNKIGGRTSSFCPNCQK